MDNKKRIVIFWEHVTDYLKASLLELLDDGNIVLVVQRSRNNNVDDNNDLLHENCQMIFFNDNTDKSINQVDYQKLIDFSPDIAVFSNAKDKRYLRLAKVYKDNGCITILASDVPRRSFIRDILGFLRGRILLRRIFDGAFVSGFEAFEYIKRIGFAEKQIYQGLYSCDTSIFRKIGIERHKSNININNQPWPTTFLFVGQFIERKGIDTLLSAYKIYRQQVPEPWDLWLVGKGPLWDEISNDIGVKKMGFVPSMDLAKLMFQSGALILPSVLDHWGVVIHEACCAGLPVITSDKCFGARDLIQEGYNGFTFSVGSSNQLAKVLEIIADPILARKMGKASLLLSYRFDPTLFSTTLCFTIPMRLSLLGKSKYDFE